ncbi:hypothetical protein EIN_018560 [Entamoeba invadens IP1]|uniref:hypothetical protein n=1 Tax=Entamoeba invadens IP1 TaxID=370355 RepID=UPI0002C3E105|nr:hypothetical protein EIN_018560 [Entamoeba invadens IP1]ELP90497.1 hypothetical protein EIN_018560 [Entamoeba invadens IP1]|eukprot:XP_004257268.1 hypothetical protein EIN_018560 [Entamoeba invadens IP1]
MTDTKQDTWEDRVPRQIGWGLLPKGSVLYDSDIYGGTSSDEFTKRIVGKRNLFFFNFDQKGNVFGAYIKSMITGTDVWIEDSNHFIISIDSTEPITSQKHWFPKGRNAKHALMVYKNDPNKLYTVGGFGYGYFTICKTNVCLSHCVNLSWEYKNMEDTDLNGTNHPQYFLTKRILVIENIELK